ncbi:MAG: hypothetical protein PHD13_05630 [Methanocellales archaeon]|nr:hypothetical protein [Methanocellales archaeon]MDD3291963.1 hypothetical protein [Methanocellales archaeon]MDD5235635.1 hypothetical protein [Methanocellales archaeon]MDD5485482.1 hypothetical protein [Methanocellales archaeon]
MAKEEEKVIEGDKKMKKKTIVELIAIAVIASVVIFTGCVEEDEVTPVKASQLTTHTAADSRPDWSPDGKKIAFISERAGNVDIWVLIP